MYIHRKTDLKQKLINKTEMSFIYLGIIFILKNISETIWVNCLCNSYGKCLFKENFINSENITNLSINFLNLLLLYLTAKI